jgi:2-octaprenyl-6-methoxyphenol hydroxylase
MAPSPRCATASASSPGASRYGQDALIANLAFESSPDGCAFERFTASGPLALLPLPDAGGAASGRAGVDPAAGAGRASCGGAREASLPRALEAAFGHRLGRVTRVGSRHSYPLALTEAVEQVRRGMVVLGNAAHALHPVAGQGFNLALRDTRPWRRPRRPCACWRLTG